MRVECKSHAHERRVTSKAPSPKFVALLLFIDFKAARSLYTCVVFVSLQRYITLNKLIKKSFKHQIDKTITQLGCCT